MVQSTAIVSLWAPVVVFAHVFAFGFFMKLFLLSSSRRFSLGRRLSNEKLPKARNSEDDEGREGNEEIVLTLDKATGRQGLSSHSGVNVMKEKTIGTCPCAHQPGPAPRAAGRGTAPALSALH